MLQEGQHVVIVAGRFVVPVNVPHMGDHPPLGIALGQILCQVVPQDRLSHHAYVCHQRPYPSLVLLDPREQKIDKITHVAILDHSTGKRPWAIIETMGITETDLEHLSRCVDLAREALEDGDEPFGSVLVDAGGHVLFEDRNRVKGGDQTRHPEFEIARWAAGNMSPLDRAAATVYTSGEHCPMCSAAHAWVRLGRIVYAASSEQLGNWLKEWEVAPGPVNPLPIQAVAPGVEVDGPAMALADDVQALHRKFHFPPGPA